MVTATMKLKDTCSLEEKLWQTQCIKKQRHYFPNKGLYSQSYSFFSSHVWMLELDHKEGWALKNCGAEDSPLDSKEVKPVNPKGNQPWISFGRTDAEAEAPVLWPPNTESRLIGKDRNAGKDWGQEEKRASEDEIDGWMASLTQWTWIWADSGR